MAHRTTPLLPRVPVARSTDCCVTPNASQLSAQPRLCGRGGPYSLSDERTIFLRRPSEVRLRTGTKKSSACTGCKGHRQQYTGSKWDRPSVGKCAPSENRLALS